jgi:hypothetical protein
MRFADCDRNCLYRFSSYLSSGALVSLKHHRNWLLIICRRLLTVMLWNMWCKASNGGCENCGDFMFSVGILMMYFLINVIDQDTSSEPSNLKYTSANCLFN